MAQHSRFLSRARKTLIGDRAFYRMVLVIVIPIIVQNAITNFVNLLDNVMVGRIGTDEMTGVSIVNQLMFVFNLCVFGGMSGAGIFAAQYHGAGDHKGVCHCLRFKLYLGIALSAVAILVFSLFSEPLIGLYLNEENADARIAVTLGFGRDYLKVMLFGLVPFALSQAYASTLRETGETSLPMRAGILAVLVNLALNYLLIYGSFGFPKMGVRGAALATIISRYVELFFIAFATHRQPNRFKFVCGLFHSANVPMKLIRQIAVKGAPLLVNEALWSIGISMIARCYSMRGLDVVSALNISNTVSNLFNTVYLSMGSATAIIIGQELGANEIDLARDHIWKLVGFDLACCVLMGTLLCIASPFVPLLYNTQQHIRHLATLFMIANALNAPLGGFSNISYFALRSGGKTMITFLFDCVFTWVISYPCALILIHCTNLAIVWVIITVQFMDLIKCILGYILLKKGVWIHNIVIQ